MKIGAGFELFLKAKLLSQDFIIRKIDEKISALTSLSKKQNTRPVSNGELCSVSFAHPVSSSPVVGLKTSSLKLSCLTRDSYRDGPHAIVSKQ